MELPAEPVIRERLEQLRAELTEAGRDDVAIVAVTKGHAGELIRRAAGAGCTAIGENYAQELRSKAPELDGLDAARPTVHFIGHVQTNKVRQLAGIVDLWETLDRRAVADELAKRAAGASALIQVNAADEPHKAGCRPSEVSDLLEYATNQGIGVKGLMTVGPTEGGPCAARPVFRAVRRMVDDLELPVCSMGMTGDYRAALDEGTTEIRVGSRLFGPRPVRHRHAR